MKIEKINDDKYSIFINNKYLVIDSFDNKDDIINSVKDIITKIKDKLNLSGFYKVKVYSNKKIGLFLDLVRLEEIDFSKVLDLESVRYFTR